MEPNRPNQRRRIRLVVRRSWKRLAKLARTPLTGLAGPLLFAPLLLTASVAPGAPVAVPADGGETPTAETAAEPAPDVPDLQDRMRRLDESMAVMEGLYETRVAPIERILARFNDDGELARRIAFALVREGEAAGIDPRVLVSVLLVENPWLDPDARSFVGAQGLMQVMPFHAGEWGCGSDDLSDLDANICHGARIFARYFEDTGGDVDRALLRYNGCVRGTNTPNCHTYPYHVYARAGEAMVHGLLVERGS